METSDDSRGDKGDTSISANIQGRIRNPET